jgi:hypothetical protein
MALEMKEVCAKNAAAHLSHEARPVYAVTSAHPSCAEQMRVACPNRGGELVRRPRREDQQL